MISDLNQIICTLSRRLVRADIVLRRSFLFLLVSAAAGFSSERERLSRFQIDGLPIAERSQEIHAAYWCRSEYSSHHLWNLCAVVIRSHPVTSAHDGLRLCVGCPRKDDNHYSHHYARTVNGGG